MATTPATGLHTMPDRALRETLRHPPHVRSLLRRAVPAHADGFDYDRLKLLDREFTLDDWRGREADLLYEIPYRAAGVSAAALVCVIIEHQSDPDPLMSLRTLLDAVLYWERQWHEYRGAPPPRSRLELRPVVPIVFYTGAKGWRTVRTLRGLLAEPAAFHLFVPDWRPVFWNLADETPDQLLNSGEEWLQALSVVRAENAAADDFQAVFEQAIRRLNQMVSADEVRWYDLMRLALTWAANRRPHPERKPLLELAVQTAVNPKHQREVKAMTMTIAEGWVEEGKIEALRETLLVLGGQRFGKPPRKQRAELTAIADPARLARMRDSLLQVGSWQDLLAIT